MESNSRRYISEIVKLKELTEDFKNLDPVAIGAQFARVRYSFPMDLLQLEQRQLLKLSAMDVKLAKVESPADLDSLKDWVESAILKYPDGKMEERSLRAFDRQGCTGISWDCRRL